MTFWLLAVGLLILASFFLVYPFVRHRLTDQGEVLEVNLQIFRDQQLQLDNQLNQKQINQTQYEQLLTEAKHLLLSNTENPEPQQPVQSEKKQSTWLLPVMLLVLPLFCLGVYQFIGASADQRILALIQQASESTETAQAFELQNQLYTAVEKRAEQRPDNIYYWILLARRAIQENDLPSAAYNYSQAIKLSPDDGYLLGQYAEILFMLADSQFTDEVLVALDKAFAIDSSNPTVLGLKGIQAFEIEKWQLAITYWQEAQRQMDPTSDTTKALKVGIARAQKRLGIESEKATASPQVQINVSIDKAIQFDPDQSVFVALVATSGAPMPLAARKLRAGDLPTTIILTNADSVMAGYNLSSVNMVKAVARLSQTGSASPQVGDWEDVSSLINLSLVKQPLILKISSQIVSK
ncbi:MAG: c-type cytochrome biogenesis protein CcmI [Porticoccaceae bacterium]